MKNRKGFTLAEMMIVMAITVVFAAAAIPAVGDSLEAARNKQREVELSAAANDAYLDILQESRKPENRDKDEFTVTKGSDDNIVKTLNEFKKSNLDELTISCAGQEISISFNSASTTDVGSVEYTFEKDDGNLQISEYVVYDINGDMLYGYLGTTNSGHL